MAQSRNGRWLAVVPILFVAGCSNVGGQARSGNRSQALTVEATAGQRIVVQRKVDLAGTLVSPDEAKVSSEVAGVVRRVAVELGQTVRLGDVLVELDSRELALAQQRAESALRQTEAQLGIEGSVGASAPPDADIASVRTASANRDDARAQFARAEQLAGRGLLPPVERETAQTHLRVAEAAYQSAIENVHSLKASLQDRRAAEELARKKLNDATIRAPVSGAVTERLIRAGEFIRENTPVMTLMQMDPLRLTTAIQERYVDVIRAKMPVQFRVESFPDVIFDGRVANISPAIDQTTRTFAVEVEVRNEDRRLKPGAFATGVILTQSDQNVIAVPESAVSTLAGVSSVYVIENGKIRQQLVVVGEHQGDLYEVLEGLNGSEQLAGSNLSQLATGVAVSVVAAGHGTDAEKTRGQVEEGKAR